MSLLSVCNVKIHNYRIGKDVNEVVMASRYRLGMRENYEKLQDG
jgi:hypothetical protein